MKFVGEEFGNTLYNVKPFLIQGGPIWFEM